MSSLGVKVSWDVKTGGESDEPSKKLVETVISIVLQTMVIGVQVVDNGTSVDDCSYGGGVPIL